MGSRGGKKSRVDEDKMRNGLGGIWISLSWALSDRAGEPPPCPLHQPGLGSPSPLSPWLAPGSLMLKLELWNGAAIVM